MDRNPGSKRKGYWLIAILLVASVPLVCAGAYQWPDEKAALTHFQDQALAEKFCPIIVQGDNIKPDPWQIYYRMAQDDSRIFIAYHVAWAYEKDETTGLLAAVNKVFYTGGLKLQKKIFGPEDIEVIEFVIDKKSGKIARIRYESATVEKVGEKVKQNHQGKEVKNAEPPTYFETITWNHMFNMLSPGQINGKKVFKLKPEYFTQERWDYYKMSKKHKNLLSQDRAHYNWELLPEKGK